ncbi:MFS general substrate transporter [Thozetella sp. PMI_491]|nr:MFS general substrate transporter [Thozetella sp. PMI_491]
MSDIEKEAVSRGAHVEETGAAVQPSKTVDTVHNDEAMRVLATYDGDLTWTDEEEKKLRRKTDWKLMPILCATYSLQYYDKAMLGQAALFGLRTDLELTVGDRYSFSSAIFYLGFIIGAYPVMILAQRFPVERVASVTVVIWGLCLLLTTQCHNFQGLYAQRFFLGLLESGISPMFMIVVSSWYKKNEQALRMGMWYCCTGYVSCVSPLINWGLGQIHGGVSSWPYMYYFAGGLTMLWGVVLWWALPAEPIRAKALNERERYIAVARLRTNNAGVRNTHFKVSQVWELLLDIKFWLCFFVAMLSMIANGPISTFIPIIINGFGFSTFNSLLLLMPCGFWSGSCTLTMTYLCYKFTHRGIRAYLFIIAQMIAVVACILLVTVPSTNKGVGLFAVFILPSVGASYGVLMGVQVANTAGYTKKSVASAGLFIGYCFGNFIGPLVYRPQDSPRYVVGFSVVIVTSFISCVLMYVYRVVCARENKKRDTAGILEGFDNAYDDDLTDKKNPQFRYIL